MISSKKGKELFSASVTCSKEKDTKKAAEELLTSGFETLGPKKADLAFCFASFQTYDHPPLIKTLLDSGKIENLIGGSTSGEICGQTSQDNSVTLLLLSSKEVRFKTAAAQISPENSVAASTEFAEKLKAGEKENPKLVVLIGTGGKGTPFPGDNTLVGMQSVFGEEVPIVGGGCGDELTFTEPLLYFQDQTLTNNQAAAVAFFGDFDFGIGVRHGWERIGRKFTITRAEGHLLKELEGKKPRDMFVEQLGEKVLEQLNDPKSGIPLIYPLGIEVEGAEELLIRTPVLFNPDGSVIIGGSGKVGQNVCLAVGSRDKILKATEQAVKQAKDQLGGQEARAILFFDCVCRKLVLGAETSKEAEIVQKAFPSAAVAGLVTYGEFGPFKSQSRKSFYHNQSAVVLALA